jgi:hypothetical protein
MYTSTTESFSPSSVDITVSVVLRFCPLQTVKSAKTVCQPLPLGILEKPNATPLAGAPTQKKMRSSGGTHAGRAHQAAQQTASDLA